MSKYIWCSGGTYFYDKSTGKAVGFLEDLFSNYENPMPFDVTNGLTTQKACEIIIHTINVYRKHPVRITTEHMKAYSLLSFCGVNSLRINLGRKNSYIEFAEQFKEYLCDCPTLVISQIKLDDSELHVSWIKINVKSVSDLHELKPLFLRIYDKACLLSNNGEPI